ncbi:hypothetical protein BASA60_006010 [Batrachochytrium salamandrivorans]|nr:hypothetical protein BASA60_006010 [Batrachochytrium salamandrivorans]KAH9253113.1 hypothetical protein BASA81_008948 [Batrachochytrium salamandrivorans]
MSPTARHASTDETTPLLVASSGTDNLLVNSNKSRAKIRDGSGNNTSAVCISTSTAELPSSTQIPHGSHAGSSSQPTSPACAKPSPTPLPFRQMLLICVVTFVEPVQFGILFPFVYFMVRDLGIATDDRDIGFYVGMLASSFCVAQLFTSLPWGWISDRYGRRPVLLFGLVGNIITCALFGTSETYAFALIMRTLGGLMNGNIGVIKSMIGEITDSSNRGIAFAYWESAFGIGTIVGPILGGLLVDPARQFPEWFGNCQLFIRFKYLLPCLAGSLVSLISAVIGYVYVEETLATPAAESTPALNWLEVNVLPQSASELDLFISNEPNVNSHCYSAASIKSRSIPSEIARDESSVLEAGTHGVEECSEEPPTTVFCESTTVYTHHHIDSDLSIDTLAQSTPTQRNSEHVDPAVVKRPDAPTLGQILTPNVLLCIASYAIWSFIQVLFEEISALFVATPIASGGLQFTSFDMGIVLSLVGISQVFGQLVVYPIAERWWGCVGCFRAASIIMIFFSTLLPFVCDLARQVIGNSEMISTDPIAGDLYTPNQKLLVYVALMFVLAGRNISMVLGFISVLILVNDSAPGPSSLGTVHGFGQVAVSFVRSVGPALGGSLWAWSLTSHLSFPFDFHFTLIATAVLSIGSVVISYYIKHGPDVVDRPAAQNSE